MPIEEHEKNNSNNNDNDDDDNNNKNNNNYNINNNIIMYGTCAHFGIIWQFGLNDLIGSYELTFLNNNNKG